MQHSILIMRPRQPAAQAVRGTLSDLPGLRLLQEFRSTLISMLLLGAVDWSPLTSRVRGATAVNRTARAIIRTPHLILWYSLLLAEVPARTPSWAALCAAVGAALPMSMGQALSSREASR